MNLLRINKLTGISVFLFLTGITGAWAQSPAHEKSRFAIIDPIYSTHKKLPETDLKSKGATWIYGPSELECWRLQLMRDRKDSAKLRVGYPGNFYTAAHQASFRLKPNPSVMVKTIRFRAVGQGKVFVNNDLLAAFPAKNREISLSIEPALNIEEIRFDLVSDSEPPALLIEGKSLSTDQNRWEWSIDQDHWQLASHFPQHQSGITPCQQEDPTVTLFPVQVENNLYDFGCELFGYVKIQSDRQPRLWVGESRAEALDTANPMLEQSLDIVADGDGSWISKNPLAFRYVNLVDSQAESVKCEAVFHPVAYSGAFACSDSLLTRIWMNSAYTIRLCMHDFMLDGIKRDRLPWAGDLAMSLMANAYAFNEPELVRKSLVVLGRAGIQEQDINGIIDYSLWWIISQDHYQLYFGDTLHLQQEWARIKEALDVLSTRCDPSGFLIPGKTWLFIDWTDQEKWSALQVLWWWAQESGARLAHRMDDRVLEDRLHKSAMALKSSLIKQVWNQDGQYWQSKTDANSMKTRYPNFLAVISGLSGTDQYSGIQQLLKDPATPPVGTPYMYGFEMMAFARLGEIDEMINRVDRYWGGMLDLGATSFWEAFDPRHTGNQHYGSYDRPFGESLCHAWSGGPAAFLPAEITGLKPLADGWTRFTVSPNLGKLDWVSTATPTSYGPILIDINQTHISIRFPKGTTLVWKGQSIAGPAVVNERIQ